MALVFAIVGEKELMLELELSPNSTAANTQAHVHQFVLHTSLDMIADKMWTSTLMNLKVVDEFNELQVHAWATASGAKLLLLHESFADDSNRRMRVEENIKNFFSEVNDAFTRVVLNPFYVPDAKLESPELEEKILALTKKWSLVA